MPADMQLSIIRLETLDEGDLRPLVDASEREGFRFVRRVEREWAAGKNRFSRPGEALFGAFVGQRLVGLCGLMLDPYANQPGVARLRNLYVLPEWRGRGIGEGLTRAVMAASSGGAFTALRLRAATAEASRLYERLGFVAVPAEPECTHRLTLTPRPERSADVEADVER